MKLNRYICAAAAICGSLMLSPALADPDKDESGHGRYKHRSSKQEYQDGHCKVERKWEGNGDFKEERKCRGGGYYPSTERYPQPHTEQEPGVVITVPPIVIPLPSDR